MSHTKGYVDSNYLEMAAGLLGEYKQREAVPHASPENSAAADPFLASRTGATSPGENLPNR